MTCDQAIRLVEKLADGEATPNERGEAEAHLDGCEDCRSHYQFVRALASASEKIDWPEPPEAYWQHFPSKVRSRIEGEPDSRSVWQILFAPGVLRFGAMAATLTVVVAVGFAVLRDDPSQMEPSMAQAPASVGKQQVYDEAAAPESQAVPESTPEELADVAPPAAVGLASAPSEPVPRARAQATPEPMQVVPPALPPRRAASGEQAEQADDVRSAEVEGELAELERSWEVDNAAELESSVVEPASEPGESENRFRSFVDSSEGEAGQAGRAKASDAAPEEAVEATFAGRLSSRASSVDQCAEWREYLERNGDDGSDSLEARYRVARCSFREFEEEPTDRDALRERALEDADRFLALESEGERADEVRRRAQELRP